MRPVPELRSVSRSRFVRIRFESLLRGFQSLNIVLPWNLIEVVISCDCVETGFNCEESTLDQLRVGSSSNFADHRYCLELSTSSIASFEPGSIALRSSSFPRAPASSIYVLSLDSPRFSLAFATSLDTPSFLSTYVVSLDFPRFSLAFATSLETPALSGFSALSVDYVASLEFPRFRRSARSSLDLPRLRSPASFTLELHYYRVLLCHSIESVWIKLISSLVLKK